jgi:uncharacterized protein GlcG (DUF336 family)
MEMSRRENSGRSSRTVIAQIDHLEDRCLLSSIRPIVVPGSSAQQVNQVAAARDKTLKLAGGQIFNPNPTDLKLSNSQLSQLSTSLASQTLSKDDVKLLLERASAVTSSQDAIIAIVDRGGNILGVRVEDGVSPTITGDNAKLTFAIDGALAKARTGAFFGNNQAPLTSRTIQMISQTSMTERVVNSSFDGPPPDSAFYGPGFVAPIGAKGHFPPNIPFTPQVDLLGIEYTNRDSLDHPGADNIKGTADDIILPNRFNVPDTQIPLLMNDSGQLIDISKLVQNGRDGNPGADATTAVPNKAKLYINAPESWGYITGKYQDAQARGIATLPGGIPIYKNGAVVGGIGVFFPGETGYATEENSALNDAGFYDPKKTDRSLEAEYIAFVTVGGVPANQLSGAQPGLATAGKIADAPALPGLVMNQFSNTSKVFGLPFGRIDLVGITLPLFGGQGLLGPQNLLNAGSKFPVGKMNGTDQPVNKAGQTAIDGLPVPAGWLAKPIDAAPGQGDLNAADVINLVDRSIVQANLTRAAIRLPLSTTAKMVVAAADKAGNVLGLYRMIDATFFSIDVAVAKSRNTAYYNNPTELQPADQSPGIPPGVSFTNRTFRYLSLPYFPEGINVYPPGPFSILNSPNTLFNGRNDGPPLPASAYNNVQAYAAFHPAANFQDPTDIANQNGVIFFPGSQALYRNTPEPRTSTLIGGFGISGDGVDQDDVVTYTAGLGYQPLSSVVPRTDLFFVRGVRLPYMKFNRQPQVSPDLPIQPKQQPITPPTRSNTALRGVPNRYFPARNS